jgi:predicted dehydrogenase
MTKECVKIGFIGCGWIVEHAHIPAFMKIENVKITSVFDVDISRAQNLSSLYKIPNAFDNINDFLNSGINAVIIATPNFTHAEYSLSALQHGVHVLCEKPVAINSEDVRNIIKTAERENILFLPGFVNRFRYDILKVREIILAKKIGDIKSIDAGWLRRAGIPRPGTWFTNKVYSGGGVLIDLGSHIVDICLMMLGAKEPASLSLLTSKQCNKAEDSNAKWFVGNYSGGLDVDVEETADAQIEYDDGILLNLKLSWAAPIEGDCTYFTINGTKGTIKLKTLFGFSNDRLWKEDSLILEEGKSNVTAIPLNRDLNHSRIAFDDISRYFINAITGQADSYLTCSDALKTVELIEKLYQAEKVNDDHLFSIYPEE